MAFPPPHLYRRAAAHLGRDPAATDRTVEVNERIRSRGATPVYTLGHLAHLTGAPPRYLRDVVTRQRDPYLDITRPKRNGRTRPISSPEPVLMDVQRWILHRVLSACEPHPASYAYQAGRSIVECAGKHVGARWLVKLDLRGFFGSIPERKIFPIFFDLGYPRLLSLELTRLCTRATLLEELPRRNDKYHGKAPYSLVNEGSLPQGAPTSGALANLIMRDADAALTDYAQTQGLTYTRYSDDLTFSAGPGFSRERAANVVNRAAAIVGREGLRLHGRKTRFAPPGARHVVLGLLVDEERVRLLPRYKRRLETHIRGVSRFGLIEHARFRHFHSVLSFINHVDGLIAFAASVDPAFAATARREWNEALAASAFRPAD